MQIETQMEGNVQVIKLSGELMAGHDSEKLRNVVDESINAENVNVVVDMEEVNWMNSSGLGMLISALTSLRSSGGDMRLANISDRIRRPIQITKLDKVFQDFDSVEEAVKSFA